MTSLKFQLYPAQRDFIYDAQRFTAFIGGIGSGKSYAGALKALYRPLRRETPTLGMVIAPTYRMLEDATWRTCLDIWEPLITDVNRSTKQITVGGIHEVLFRSAEDPERLRGPNLHWFWLDEARGMRRMLWPIVIGRLRADGEAGEGWLTTTPNGFDWVYDLIQSNEMTLHRASTKHNPFLSSEFIDSLIRQYPSDFAQQELDGGFITLGAGLIRRSWFDVVAQPPSGLNWARFWDLAASTKTGADYTASVRAAVRDGVIYLDGLIRGRWEWPDTRRIILQTIRSERDTINVGVENVAFQLAAVQELQRAPEGLHTAIRSVSVDRDKLSRALPWIAQAEQSRIKLVAGSNWNEFLSEAEQFPEGEHDDIIDAVSGAIMLADVPPAESAYVETNVSSTYGARRRR